jgi:hypothetical protein
MGSMPAWLVLNFIILFSGNICDVSDFLKYRSLHDRANPNVRDVGHCYRINKVADRTAELEDYNVIFNV